MENSLKNVESDNNNILCETLLDIFLQRHGTYCLNKPRTFCEYEGLLYFFIFSPYLGTKLCSAVGRTLGCAAAISSALRARRPAVLVRKAVCFCV